MAFITTIETLRVAGWPVNPKGSSCLPLLSTGSTAFSVPGFIYRFWKPYSGLYAFVVSLLTTRLPTLVDSGISLSYYVVPQPPPAPANAGMTGLCTIMPGFRTLLSLPIFFKEL